MNYILGGGITGLITAFYKKDYKIITPEVGGQMGSSFNLGPRYLHDTKDSRHLLKNLDIPIKESVIKVGYISDQGWVDEPDNKFRENYFKKSRGVNNLNGFDASVMNTNKSEFNILLVNFQKMIEKLEKEIGDRFIGGSVQSIDPIVKMIEIKNDVIKIKHYDKIISTIPLDIFDKIYINKTNIPVLNSDHMTYVLIHKDKLYDLKDFDYVYDSRMSIVHHRYTREFDDLVLDIFGDISEHRLNEMFSKVLSCKILYNSQIISEEIDFSEFENITFVGRYGTWNRKWKTEMVIKEARKKIS